VALISPPVQKNSASASANGSPRSGVTDTITAPMTAPAHIPSIVTREPNRVTSGTAHSAPTTPPTLKAVRP